VAGQATDLSPSVVLSMVFWGSARPIGALGSATIIVRITARTE
jgi:hypothetical protein